MKMNRKMAAAGLAGCMIAGMLLSGCGTNGKETAIKVNDDVITVGQANFFLRYQQAQSTYMMQQYGMYQSGASLWDQDYTASSDSSISTYGDSLKDSAKNTLIQDICLKEHAADYNLALSDELNSALDTAAEKTYSENEDTMKKLGTSQEDIRCVLELSSYQSLMYDSMTADVDTNVSDDDAKQSTITYARINLTKQNDSGDTVNVDDDAKAKYKTTMEELLKEIQKADDPATTDITSQAKALDSDNIVSSTLSYGSDDTTLPDAVKEAAATLKDGEVYDGVIDTGDYYYVIRMDAVLDRDATDSKKESIVSERKQNAYNDLLKSWTDAADVTLTNAWNKLEVTDKDGYTVYVAPTDSASQSSASGTDSATSSSAGSVTSSSAGSAGSSSVSSSSVQ